MRRKVAALWVSLLIMVSSIVILVEIADRVEAPSTLYVGGGGGGNYSKIQWAIDNASDGDTVFVYNGTYYENVVVDKTITLTGEDRDTTVINGSGIGDVVLITTNYVNITFFTVVYSGGTDVGIDGGNTNNCSIVNNTCIDNHIGIYFSTQSYNNTIMENTITNNSYRGLHVHGYNNTVSNNTVSFNNEDGIYISGYYHTIVNNTVFSNCINTISAAGIYLNSGGCYVHENRVFNNRGDNIGLWRGYGGNIISTNNLSNNGPSRYGIYLYEANSNYIIENEVTTTTDAIRLYYSMYNNISNNNLIKSGISVYSSDFNNLSNNKITIFDYSVGLLLSSSSGNNLTANEINGNGIVIMGRMLDQWNTHFIDQTNKVNGRPVFYIKNENGGKVPSGMGEVLITNSTNITIENLDMTYPNMGIHLGYSWNCRLFNNTVSSVMGARYGMSLYRSSGNHIYGNTIYSNQWPRALDLELSNDNLIERNNISNNGGGIALDHCDDCIITRNLIFSNSGEGLNLVDSSFNYLYHNNIIDNSDQADDLRDNNYWDNGYPLGGNYWSDYTGDDDYYGPNQDIPGRDGIGDSRYYIDFNSPDNYPLMEPIENYIELSNGWNFISIPFIQTDQNPIKVLEMLNGRYDAIQLYNPTDASKPWKHHRVGKTFGNDLFKLNETMGFWVHINQSGETLFLCNGLKPVQNQTIQLHPGWNMVGYPSLSNHNRTVGLNNLTFDTHVDVIQWYDASTKTWHFMGPTDNFVPGRGYWVYSKVETIWEVPI